MKVTTEHREIMKSAIITAIKTIGRDNVECHRSMLLKDERVKDVAMRFRWDLMYAAKLSPFVCAHVYSYTNDEHIDTALRQMMRELGLEDTHETE